MTHTQVILYRSASKHIQLCTPKIKGIVITKHILNDLHKHINQVKA